MASNPSQNNAFELITTGEKTGTWGTITNSNLNMIDRATKGVGTITLSGTSYTLSTLDYTPSDGNYLVLVFAGSPSGTCTVTLNPNDQQKFFVVRNTTAQSVVLTQGSGGNVTIPTGKAAVVYATGSGASSTVVDMTALFVSTYNDASVDTHLNTATASSSEVLSWTGTDYDWIARGATSLDELSDAKVVGSGTNTTIAVGLDAGASYSTQTNSTALGAYAGNTATGSFCTFVGSASGSRVSGNGNTAIGYNAMQGPVGGTSGTANSAVGVGSLANLTTGENNTAAGHSSAPNATTGSRNVFCGYFSGSALTTGADNVFLGFTAGDNTTTGNNNVVIGGSASASSATASNEITLGNSTHTVLRLPFSVTVSALPSASVAGTGARSFVTDANATTFASIVAGGGSNRVPVYSDGTSWRIG
jgi:hypothetical protein